MKFYAVKKGRIPGVYRSWDEAKKQVDGFSGAEYKSFSQFTDAVEFANLSQETQDEIMKPSQDNLQAAINKIKQKSEAIKNTKSVVDMKGTSQKSHEKYFATIFTDGGSRNHGTHKGGHVLKTDKAAWAYLIQVNEKELSSSGGEYGATNNKMEMTGFLEALKKLISLGYNKEKLLFCLDSQYVLNAVDKDGKYWLGGWKKRGWETSSGKLANKELWQEIDSYLEKFPDIHYQWVKGHDKSYGNNFVDHKLNEYMDKM